MIKTVFLSLLFSATLSTTIHAQAKPRTPVKQSVVKAKPKLAETPAAIFPVNDTTASWNDAEQKSFMDACVPSSKMGKEKGTAFCHCMLEKIITLYPKPADAASLTKEATTELAKECYADTRKSDSTWSSMERSAFLKECSGKAIKNMKAAQTKTYCNCMLGKIEKAYPNPLDAEKMTPDELNKWAKECGGL